MTIRGTGGDDDLTGTTGDDVFNMTQGGDDTVHGGHGNDIFQYGATLTAADRIDGGAGIDTLTLGGDYSGANAFTFDGVNITAIEKLQLRGGFSYDFTFTQLTGVAGKFTIDGHMLGVGDSLTVDASALQSSPMVMIGGAGNDVLIGIVSHMDTFDLSRGGDDTATGGDASDLFQMGRGLSTGDRLDGGGGNNTMELRGPYGDPHTASPFVFDDATIANIQTVRLLGNFVYDLKLANGNVAAGKTMVIDASAVGAHRAVMIDASAETDGSYTMIASAGDNTLIGGAKADTFIFHGTMDGGDFIDGGGGGDVLSFGQISDLVVDASNISNIGKLSFTGTSDMALTGTFAGMTLDAKVTAGFGADISGASVTFLQFLGGSGDDTLAFGGDYSTNDFIDGGRGFDTVSFNAPSLTLNLDGHFESVEKVVLLGAASSYNVTLDTDFDPLQSTTFIDASALTDASSSLHLDASRQYTTFVNIAGGAGDDVITGSGNFDTITGGAGDDVIKGGNDGDTLTGGSGSDTFVYAADTDSYARFEQWDSITDFDATADFLKLNFAVTYDGETSGSVSRPATELSAIVNPLMTVNGAVLVNVTGGKLAGHLLLAVDSDHDGQYTTEMLIDLTGMANVASFGSGDFIT